MTEQEVVTDVVPVETAETPVVPTGDTAKPEGAEVKPVGEKTFTQSELNEIVEKRLARERQKRERELEVQVRALREQQAPKVETPSDPAAPKREDFDSYEDYIRADARYVSRQEVRAEREAEAKATKEAKEQEERNAAMREFQKREAPARAKYGDFDEMLSTPPPVTNAMFDAIMALDEGWDVTYHLWKNPEEAQRIAQLNPTRQAAEIGKLAAKVGAAPAPKPASVSRAPEPIDTTRSGTTVVTDKPPEDPNEYKQWHDAQMRARYSGKRT